MDAGEQVRVRKADRLKLVQMPPVVEAPAAAAGAAGQEGKA
jgi:hypothetical protein